MRILRLKYYLVILLVITLNSCIPDESPVKPFDRGDAIKGNVNMSPLYVNQIYYSLDQNKVLKSNLVTDWDISFSCSPEGYEIFLNFGKFMKAYNLGFADFDTVTKQTAQGITDDQWQFDNSEGKIDSTAIGKWWEQENGDIVSYEHVYIIDRGIDEKSKALGFAKLQILGFSNNEYHVKFGNLKTGEVSEIRIPKNDIYNYIQLSFDDGGSVKELEPPKGEWDLLFTKYTQLLYTDTGEKMWYGVSSVLTNPFNVEAAFIKNGDFYSINTEILDTISLSKYRNTIGHEWKDFDLEAGSYIVYPQMVYIVKGVSGFIYKLHFLEFYDNAGNKGYPVFEYQKL